MWQSLECGVETHVLCTWSESVGSAGSPRTAESPKPARIFVDRKRDRITGLTKGCVNISSSLTLYHVYGRATPFQFIE